MPGVLEPTNAHNAFQIGTNILTGGFKFCKTSSFRPLTPYNKLNKNIIKAGKIYLENKHELIFFT